MGLPPVATVWSYLSTTYRSSRPSQVSLKKLLLNAGTGVLIDRPTVIQFCRNLPTFTQRQGSLPLSQQPITRHFLARIIQSTLSNPNTRVSHMITSPRKFVLDSLTLENGANMLPELLVTNHQTILRNTP